MIPLDRGRMAHLLGMLGSDHDGEVLNAARAVERLRKGAGLTWPDILDETRLKLPLPAAEPTIDGTLRFWSHGLTDWERGFLQSVRFRQQLSPKQRDVLHRIFRKVQDLQAQQ